MARQHITLVLVQELIEFLVAAPPVVEVFFQIFHVLFELKEELELWAALEGEVVNLQIQVIHMSPLQIARNRVEVRYLLKVPLVIHLGQVRQALVDIL